jgi:hypothetical protein
MAHSIDGYALDTPHVNKHVSTGLWKLRLAFGCTILFAALVGLFALSWDIQWHIAVGRDRTLTAPHLFILGSAMLMGLAALASVLIETVWARHSIPVAKSGTTFAGFFSSSLGAYLVGYGALDAAIGFPIDQYWHTLYGVDVAIWAPFHVMLLTGFCICCLGVTYMLIEGARLAEQQGATRAARVEYLSAIVALATLMGMLSIFLPSALSTGYVSLGKLAFTVYPLMLGIMGTFVLSVAIRALPWRRAATSVAVIYMLFGVVQFLLIPPLMTWLLGVEQQRLLPMAPRVSFLAMFWQYPLIVAAILLDSLTWLAQRRKWSRRRRNRVTFVAASVGMSLAALFYPFFIHSQLLSTAFVYSMVSSGSHIVVHTTAKGIRAVPPQMGMNMTSVVIVVISLLLGVLGTYGGYWLGGRMGDGMQRKDQ